MTMVNIGKGIVIDVDMSAFPDNVRDHVMYIGVRNILMDSHANITRESDGENVVANSTSVANKKLDAMYNGEVRIGATRAPRDPIGAIMARMATNEVHKIIKGHGKNPAKVQKAWMTATVTKRLADNDARLRAAAQKEVDDVAALVAGSDIDVSDIPTE